jgi:hypothetical protein
VLPFGCRLQFKPAKTFLSIIYYRQFQLTEFKSQQFTEALALYGNEAKALPFLYWAARG